MHDCLEHLAPSQQGQKAETFFLHHSQVNPRGINHLQSCGYSQQIVVAIYYYYRYQYRCLKGHSQLQGAVCGTRVDGHLEQGQIVQLKGSWDGWSGVMGGGGRFWGGTLPPAPAAQE